MSMSAEKLQQTQQEQQYVSRSQAVPMESQDEAIFEGMTSQNVMTNDEFDKSNDTYNDIDSLEIQLAELNKKIKENEELLNSLKPNKKPYSVGDIMIDGLACGAGTTFFYSMMSIMWTRGFSWKRAGIAAAVGFAIGTIDGICTRIKDKKEMAKNEKMYETLSREVETLKSNILLEKML